MAALPRAEIQRLRADLEEADMAPGQVLLEPEDSLSHVYFPIDCIVSLLYVMEDGASAEIAVVGNEGLLGIPLIMAGGSTPSRAVVQSGGKALRLPASAMVAEFKRGETLMRVTLRYAQALLAQMAQTAVCNRHHSVDQQLCRWLLLSLDRLEGNQLPMTQQLIANMLGVRRTGVSGAARNLMRRGLIAYSRGHVTVLDRWRLEQSACECYAVIRHEYDRLLVKG